MSWLNKIGGDEFTHIQIYTSFNRTIKNIEKITIPELDNFFNILPSRNLIYNNILNLEFHNMFVLLMCVKEKNESMSLNLKRYDIDLIILNYISNFGKNVKKSFNTIFKKVFKESESAKESIDFYTLLDKKDYNDIKSDCISIFINTTFQENDPININDIEKYYEVKLKIILYTYLKNKTEKLINNQLEGDELFYTSTRLDFFAAIIKSCQLKDASKSSLSTETIKNNFDFTNFIPDFNKKKKMQISVSKNDINHIQISFPTVYKLLKSINIKNGNPILTSDECEILLKNVEFSLSNKFNNKFDDNISSLLSKKMANNIITHISTSDYIDPNTLTTVKFNHKYFLEEFPTFLEYIFK